MQMSKIGFVSFAHPDYMDDMVRGAIEIGRNLLRKIGCEPVGGTEIVSDYAGALEAGKRLAAADPDGVVLFLAGWVECSAVMAVLREIEHLPFCLQAFPMMMYNGRLESTGSYVSFAMFKGTLDRVGYVYTPVLGDLEGPQTQKALARFCLAARTVKRLRRSRIGLVGYSSMSIYPGTFDHVMLRVRIGPEVEHSDSYTLINAAERVPFGDKLRAAEEFRRAAAVHDEVPDESLIKAGGIYAALNDWVDQRGLDAVNIKCQYEFSKEYKMVPCVPLSRLAERVVASCEGDILNTVSMLILRYITGQTVTYGDAVTHCDNTVKLSACGFLPFSMAEPGKALIRNFMPHPGFSGIQSSFVMRPERVTVMRLVEDRCDYHILYFTGTGLPTRLRQDYMPALDIRLDGDVEDLVRNYAGQHFAICYGDVSEEIEETARFLRVKTLRV